VSRFVESIAIVLERNTLLLSWTMKMKTMLLERTLNKEKESTTPSSR